MTGIKSNRVLRGTLLIIITLLAGCPVLLGQAQRAIILGLVKDPSGALMPGVAVSVIEQDTNVTWSTVTNADGYYEVPGLFPGTYRVEAAFKGFKSTVVDNVHVDSAQRAPVNIQMQVGAVSQSVTVVAANERLDTASSTVNTEFRQQEIANLPIGEGHAATLLYLAPGNDGFAAGGFLGLDIQPMQRALGTRFAGSPVGTTEYSIDGSPNTQEGNAQAGGSMAYTPSPQVVQEVRVQTALFDASQGHTGGSTVDLELKSGTNEYHGVATWDWRPVDLQANSWSNNSQHIPLPTYAYDFYDFNGGGPVRLPFYNGKDRTFFYYGFEKWDGLSGNPTGYASVPTAAELQGDFSALLPLGSIYQIYDPATSHVAANGLVARNPFLGNIIPSNRINDPIFQGLKSYWPAPNTAGQAGGVQNFAYLYQPFPRRLWGSTVRIDHNLSKSQKLFGHYLQGTTGIFYTGVFNDPQVQQDHYSGRDLDIGVGDVWTVSPSFIADIRLDDTRFHWDISPTGVGTDYSKLGLGQLNSLFNTSAAGFPYVNITGYPSVGAVSYPTFYGTGGQHQVSEIRSFVANFTAIRGHHSIRFGPDLRYYFDNRGSLSFPELTYTGAFSTGPYYNSPAPPVGVGLSDFELGAFATATALTYPQLASMSTYQGAYVQDDWRAMPKLTLNLGVRYEREGPASERYNRNLIGFDLTDDNPVASAAQAAYALNPIPQIPASQFRVKGGAVYAGAANGEGALSGRRIYNSNNLNFSPRVGLSYQLSNHMVAHAGYGIYFIPENQRFFTSTPTAPGYSTSTITNSSVDNGLTFPITTAKLFPNGLLPVTGSSLGLLTNVGQSLSVTALQGHLPSAYNQRWDSGVEMVFANNYKLSARYVGNRTIKMPISKNLNALPDKYLSTLSTRDTATINTLTSQVPNPFVGIPGVTGSLGTGKTVALSQLLLPYPEFTSVSYNAAQGWTTYESLQVEFTRRFSSGAMLTTNYTRASWVDALSYLNAGDNLPWSGTSGYNRPNIWRFIGVYELPFGEGKPFLSHAASANKLTRRLINGWQIEDFGYIQTGTPTPVEGGTWGDVLYTGPYSAIGQGEFNNPQHMFNTAGFNTNPAQQLLDNLRTFPYVLGNVRTAREWDTDFSLQKNIQIKERANAQFKIEAYNVLNGHFYYGTVTNTPTSTAFGTINVSSGARAIQLVFKFEF